MVKVFQFLLLSACSALVFAQLENQDDLRTIADGLKVTWNVVTNTKTSGRFAAEITLQNTAANLNLTSGEWEIHFSSIFRIESDLLGVIVGQGVELPGQDFNLTHLQGDHYYLKPGYCFITLPPGASRKIKLKVDGFSVARTDAMPNWYMAYPGLHPVVIASTQGEDLTFVAARTSVQQWKRFSLDEYNPFTTQERYDRNYVADSSYSSEIRVIPKPASVLIGPDPAKTGPINGPWIVYYDAGLANEASYLAKTLGLQNVSGSSSGPNVIQLSLSCDSEQKMNSSDYYNITVNAAGQRIDIVGQAASGVFYGVVTLLSLMDNNNQVPECVVIDSPRFEYRGLMLDIASSFQPKEEILRVIELMASYKLNKLHLRLSGDEGWRIQIPALPELTELGSQRCHDPFENECLMPQLGSGPDNSTFGSGFLTTSDYTEILRHANEHHVTVIPEIDMPGHGRAAIVSMKLRNIIQSGEGQPVYNTTLVEPDDPSSSQIITDNAINPCLESTYNFIDIVLDELIELHNQGQQPLKTFHFGGGKVDEGAWLNSSACRNLTESVKLPAGSYRQYFYQRVYAVANSRNLSLGSKEDGLMDDRNKPFNLSADAIGDTVAYSWNSVWKTGTPASTYRLANYGLKVVLNHASHLYLDHPYEPDPEERGTYWAARFTDTKKLFAYNAEHYYANDLPNIFGQAQDDLCNLTIDNCPGLTRPENIVGMEGTLFTTTTRNRDHLYHNLFPRLLALAERAWHKAPWESVVIGDKYDEQLNEDWLSFARAVGHRELPKLALKNIPYRIPPPGAVISFGRLLTTTLYPGLVAQYRFDAGSNWQDAPATVPVGDYQYRIWLRTRTVDSKRFSRTVVLEPGQSSNITGQAVINYISQMMEVKYTVVDNYKKYGDEFYEARIQLSNMGTQFIPGGTWRIYFTSVNVIEPTFIQNGRDYFDNAAKITMAHAKGYLYSLGPATDFPGIAPGANLELTFRVSYWSVSRYEQMPRWYVASPGMNAKNLLQTMGDDLAFVTPFTKPEQWKRYEYDQFTPWTPEFRYDRNLGREVAPLSGPPVIPTPFSYKAVFKKINLMNGPWTVQYGGEEAKTLSQKFIDLMAEYVPDIKLVLNTTAQTSKVIRFQIEKIDNNNTEAYKIKMDAQTEIIDVTGGTEAGGFYGAVTLIQLALKSNSDGSFPESQIEDWPRLAYRGMHVDTARNFIPKDNILKLLKVMSLYKLNKLHFHLTDDEGWRLEIPGLEELTKVGGHRCHDLEETECVMSTLGSGADDTNIGSGFYTVADYQEILRLAESLHIEVIPEFDTPGHAHAAIKSMRVRQSRLKDQGNHTLSDEYLLDDDNDTSHYFSVQYYTDNAVNPCIDSTYAFIEKVYTEVKKIHESIQPLKVFHFGGDEVAKGAWMNSSACVDLRRSGASLKSEFTQRVSNITKDVDLGAWEDGLMDHESIPWNRSLLLNKEVIVQTWQNVWEWGNAARAYNLANNDYKVIFSPVTHMYFDHPNEPSPDERGFYWGTRYTDAYKTFSFMPDNYYMNADIKRSGEPITMDEICTKDNSGCPPLKKPENILGLQGQLWAETVHLPEDFEYLVYPRILALAERAWHKGSWEGLNLVERDPGLKKDWSAFAMNLGLHDLAILDKLGVGYRVPPPGARQVKYTISTKVEFPGLHVQYKVGSADWSILQPTKTFSKDQEVSLRTVSPDGKRFSTEVKIVIAYIPPAKDSAVSASLSCLSVIFAAISVFFQVL